METYSGASAIAGHEANLWFILPFCLLTFAGAYMLYFGAIRNGFKDHTYSIPLGCNLWFMAHDITYVGMGYHWFVEVDFWLIKGFWFGLLVFSVCELVVYYQLVRFSRAEIFSGFTALQSMLALVFAQSCAFILFWWFRDLVPDPIYLISFTTTIFLGAALTIPMMLWRGTRQGFSPFMLIGFILQAAGFYPWVYFAEPYFQTPIYLALGAMNVVVSAIPLWIYYKLPAYTRPAERSAAQVHDGVGAVPD